MDRKRKVAAKALATFKQRIRQLTRRSGGRSMQNVVDRLRSYVLGWKGYFRLAQTPRVWRTLDEWLRHRLRARMPDGVAGGQSTRAAPYADT